MPKTNHASRCPLGFRTWISQFRNESSHLGDVADGMELDGRFPYTFKSLDEALDYLGVQHAVREVDIVRRQKMTTAWEAYALYLRRFRKVAQAAARRAARKAPPKEEKNRHGAYLIDPNADPNVELPAGRPTIISHGAPSFFTCQPPRQERRTKSRVRDAAGKPVSVKPGTKIEVTVEKFLVFQCEPPRSLSK